ncbi:hypothetical protein ACFVWG_20680 [Kribbella sp. NPDC058245]|uniref:hypothetical protein n=1 Tax=Kribbella sp. NPDC058245 TaxID=3346399 RepID=UPI0036E5B72E
MASIVFFSEGPLTYFSPVSSSTGVPVITDVTADEYLSFAKSDIEPGTLHGAINGLGNAKRALHLMIDTVLQNYGMLVHNPANFPTKLKLLDQVGLIALNVFGKLNIERNVAEHEYSAPSVERVQEFIDVCHLLRLALERLGQDVPYQVVAGIRDTGEHVLLELEPLLGYLSFRPLIEPVVRTISQFGTEVEFVTTIYRVPEAVGISESPSRTLELRSKNVDEWAGIINGLVEYQGRTGRVTRVEHDLVTIWQSMTIPTGVFNQTRMAEMFAARVHREEANTDDLSGLTPATTSLAIQPPGDEAAPV